MKVCEHKWEKIDGMMCHLCKYERCSVCGSIRRTEGCVNHLFRMEHYSHPSYYRDIFENGIPRADEHCEQLLNASLDSKIGLTIGKDYGVLEIGAGLGLYCPLFNSGNEYVAIEPSEFGANFIRRVYCSLVIQDTAEAAFKQLEGRQFETVFSAHWLEHMPNADYWFEKMAEKARKQLICLVPIGTDTANRDHWWYFTAEVLNKWAAACGFDSDVVRKSYSPHEDFLFLFAKRREQ